MRFKIVTMVFKFIVICNSYYDSVVQKYKNTLPTCKHNVLIYNPGVQIYNSERQVHFVLKSIHIVQSKQ